jgi:hypothetical protein
MAQLIPLSTAPNQTLIASLSIDGGTIDLQLGLHYNEIAGWWVMTVSDSQGDVILDSIPFITGSIPAGNILGQYEYLEIGGAVIINASQAANDYPNNTQLGVDFYLLWIDNASYTAAQAA